MEKETKEDQKNEKLDKGDEIDEFDYDSFFEKRKYHYTTEQNTNEINKPIFTSPGKPRWLGWTNILGGLALLIFLAVIFSTNSANLEGGMAVAIIGIGFILGLALLYITAGIRLLKNNKKVRKK